MIQQILGALLELAVSTFGLVPVFGGIFLVVGVIFLILLLLAMAGALFRMADVAIRLAHLFVLLAVVYDLAWGLHHPGSSLFELFWQAGITADGGALQVGWFGPAYGAWSYGLRIAVIVLCVGVEVAWQDARP